MSRRGGGAPTRPAALAADAHGGGLFTMSPPSPQPAAAGEIDLDLEAGSGRGSHDREGAALAGPRASFPIASTSASSTPSPASALFRLFPQFGLGTLVLPAPNPPLPSDASADEDLASRSPGGRRPSSARMSFPPTSAEWVASATRPTPLRYHQHQRPRRTSLAFRSATLSKREEAEFRLRWARERFAAARVAMLSGLLPFFCVGVILTGGVLSRRVDAASLAPAARGALAQAVVAVCAFSALLTGLSFLGPARWTFRRSWQAWTTFSMLLTYAATCVVCMGLEMPTLALVVYVAGAFYSAVPVGLRFPQVALVNGAAFLLALAIVVEGRPSSPQPAEHQGAVPVRAWEGILAAPACASGLVLAVWIAYREDRRARQAFVREREMEKEKAAFRMEHAHLVQEYESFVESKEELAFESPLTCAATHVGGLLRRLLADGLMEHAVSAASCLRHLLSSASLRVFDTALEDQVEKLREQETPCSRGFHAWFRMESGVVAESLRRRSSAGGASPSPRHSRAPSMSLNRTRLPSLSSGSSRFLEVPGSNPEGPLPEPSDERAVQLARMLEAAARSWTDFDAIALDEITEGRALQVLSMSLMRRAALPSGWSLSLPKLAAFLAGIERGYLPNPYHSSAHAADVLQATHFLCTAGDLKTFVYPQEVVAVLLSAVVHDVGHTGRNNAFEVATNSELALLYNDHSVLENHSATLAFALLRKEETGFLEGLSREERAEFRKTVINTVLATDMGRHFDLLGAWKSGVLAEKTGAVARLGRSRSSRSLDDRRLDLALCLKVADLANSARPLEQHVRWCRRVNEEFHAQGDQERSLGLPVSPYCDRATASVEQTTGGFLSFLAVPLMTAWASRFPAAQILVDTANANLEYWQSVLAGAGTGGAPRPAAAAAAAAPPPAPPPAVVAVAPARRRRSFVSSLRWLQRLEPDADGAESLSEGVAVPAAAAARGSRWRRSSVAGGAAHPLADMEPLEPVCARGRRRSGPEVESPGRSASRAGSAWVSPLRASLLPLPASMLKLFRAGSRRESVSLMQDER